MRQTIRHVIPNGLTCLNLTAGILAILLSSKSVPGIREASLLILIAAFFDFFDGFLARRWNTVSDLGKELDSLADLVSFGVAPVLVAWHGGLIYWGVLGMLVLGGYMISGALRLARFNLQTPSIVHYRGLPITAAGLVICIAVLAFSWTLPPAALMVLVVVLAVLMNAPWSIPRFAGRAKT